MVWIVLGIIFLAIAIGLYKYRLYNLIAGYNRMTEEQKEETNLRALSVYYAIVSLFIALLFFTMAVLSFYHLQSLFTSIFVIIVIVVVGGIMDSQRYIKTLTDEYAKPVKIAKYKYKQLLGYLCGAGVIVALIIYFALKPITISIMDETLEITGSYGNTYPISAIESLALTDNHPNIETIINGTEKRGQLQGLVQLEHNEQATFYINENVKSYISFVFDGDTVYINMNTIKDTIALFEQLQNRLKLD